MGAEPLRVVRDDNPQRVRLRELESQVHRGLEQFYKAGIALREIRDAELYKLHGFDDFPTYAKQTFELSKTDAYRSIQTAEYRERLPSPNWGLAGEWSQSHVRELVRIETLYKSEHDYSNEDARREALKVAPKVAKMAIETAKAEDKKLTAKVVRETVNAYMGYTPPPAFRPEPWTPPEPEPIDIGTEFYTTKQSIEGFEKVLREFDPAALQQWIKEGNNKYSVQFVYEAMDSLRQYIEDVKAGKVERRIEE